MKHRKIYMSLIAVAILSNTLNAKEINSTKLDDVYIVEKDNITENSKSYLLKQTDSATKMDINLLETPLSVSVVTNQKIKDYNLSNINRVLANTSGITIEKMESDRTLFTSRGFNVNNFLIDGVSLPLALPYVLGDIDMAIYDHITITKGATGLNSAHGNPSASINMIRKRPTKDLKGSFKLSAGSWEKRRGDFDISGALNDKKTIRARLIAVKEKGNSYLERYDFNSDVISAIIEADVNDTMLIRMGIASNGDKNNGTQWGGIPAIYKDGTLTNYNISTNASSDWTFRNIRTTDSYIDIENIFSNDWKVKASYLFKKTKNHSNLINLWGTPNKNEIGLVIDQAQNYNADFKEHVFDLTFDGKYSLFGRTHDAMIGFNIAKRDIKENSIYSSNLVNTPINLKIWNGSTQTPIFDGKTNFTDMEEKNLAFFAASNYYLLDNLNLLVGARLSNWETSGESYGSDQTSDDKAIFTPYLGLVYKILDNVSIYSSYATSFKPQNYIDKNAKLIDPAKGINYEFGVKSSHFNNKLNTAFSVFYTKQDNVAKWGGRLPDKRTFYTAQDDVKTKGFELEIGGALSESLDLSLGYTKFKVKDNKNNKIKKHLSNSLFKSMLTYNPTFARDLKLGVSYNWQDKISTKSRSGEVKQKAIGLVDLMASYKINKNMNLAINIENLTDEKYYGSLLKSYVTYAAPRKIGVSLEYKF